MTVVFVDIASAALAKGDVVCLVPSAEGMTVVTKAVPAAIAASGFAYGLAEAATAPGDPVNAIREGLMPSSLTGLSATTGKCRISSLGRCEHVSSYIAGDFPLGAITPSGFLNLVPAIAVGSLPSGNIASISAGDSITITGTTDLTVSLDAASVASIALIDPAADALADLATIIQPSGDVTGVIDRTAIQAALGAAGAEWALDPVVPESRRRRRQVRLAPGKFYINSQLVHTSGVDAVAAGCGVTQIWWSGSAGDPLNPLNAMWLMQGAANPAGFTGSSNSTASSKPYYPAGSQAVSVTVTAGALPAAGTYVAWQGSNYTPDDTYYSPGGAHAYREILLVESAASGLIQFRSHTLLHHTNTSGAGMPVSIVACTPLRHAAIKDMSFHAPGQTMADAINVDYGTDIEFSGLGFEGFARFPIELGLGTVNVHVGTCHSYGENNSFVGGFGAHLVRMALCSTNPNGKRYHAEGRIRGMVSHLDSRNVGWKIDTCTFNNTSLPFQLWGTDDCDIRSCTSWNSDVDELFTRDSASSDDHAHGLQMGTVFDMAAGNLTTNLINVNIQIVGCTGWDARSSSLEASALYLHDTFFMLVSGCKFGASGRSPYETIDGQQKFMCGMRHQDWGGIIVGCITQGVQYAYRHNSSQGVTTRNCSFLVHPGAGFIPAVCLYIDHADPCGLLISGVTMTGGVFFGPNFVNDPTFRVEQISYEGVHFTGPCWAARNKSVATRNYGEIMSVSPTTNGFIDLVQPVASDTAPVVVANAPGYGPVPDAFTLVQHRGGCVVLCSSAEVRPGQHLRAVGTTYEAVADASVTTTTDIGVAMSYKAGGAPGYVQVAA